MEKMVFSIRDNKSQIFQPPFMAHNNADAERSIIAAASAPNSMIGQFPTDFELYFVGKYDDSTGKFLLEDAPIHLTSVVKLLPKN